MERNFRMFGPSIAAETRGRLRRILVLSAEPVPMPDHNRGNCVRGGAGDLENSAVLPNGTRVMLRPIGPEDEPLLHDLAGHMTSDDLRLRFFAPVRGITHALASRLTHLDDSREMALVALHDGTTLGVARFSADPGRLSAEFAIAVRTDWHGRGVGYLLMSRLIEAARKLGVGELVGFVLRENRPMLGMCRALGFSVAADSADAAVVRVRKPLEAK